MIRLSPILTLSDTLFPYTTLFLSIDGNALGTSPRSGLKQRRAQERQSGGSSLCDRPGESVPVPTLEEAPAELRMDLEREVGRQILMSHFIGGRKIEIGGIFAGAGGGIDIDFQLDADRPGLACPGKDTVEMAGD